MPKQKTNKSVKKRLKLTGRGKLKRRKAGLGHLLSKKRPKRKRRLRKQVLLAPSEVKRAQALLGRR